MLDLCDLDAIQSFADWQERDGLVLDPLIKNAGELPPMQRALTPLGHELGTGVSVVGQYQTVAYYQNSLKLRLHEGNPGLRAR